MNEHEVHVKRISQINAVLPELLKPNKELSCLYVGATPWRFQLGKELHDAGYSITLLEVDKDNWYYYIDHPWLTGGCIHGNVSSFETDRRWDVVVWWHGPEHIALEHLETTLRKLESMATQLVVLAAPWGENLQPAVEGNSNQEHKAHLQPSHFESLGYKTATCGDKEDLSTWPHILAWKHLNANVPQRVIYTAIFNDYDQLYPADKDVRSICFTDHPIETNGWETVIVERRFSDPRRESRMYKTLAHQWFQNTASSLWIDGNCELLVSSSELFAYLEKADIVMPRHPTNKTLTNEAELIVKLNKAPTEQVQKQMAHYPNHNLAIGATSWLLRNHTDTINSLNEAWWSELTVHTLRDQLSLPYCLDRFKISPYLIDVDLYNNKLVRVHPHRGVG